MVSSWEQEDMASGMAPSREFMLRLRYVSRVNRPMSGEMWPLRWLFGMWILSRKSSSVTQGNIWPVRFSDSRSNETTRDALSVLHLTPCQSQGVRDTLLQEASAREGSESWDLRQRSASRSVECTQGSRISKGIVVKTSRKNRLCVARRGIFFACVLDEHLVHGSVFIYIDGTMPS